MDPSSEALREELARRMDEIALLEAQVRALKAEASLRTDFGRSLGRGRRLGYQAVDAALNLTGRMLDSRAVRSLRYRLLGR